MTQPQYRRLMTRRAWMVGLLAAVLAPLAAAAAEPPAATAPDSPLAGWSLDREKLDLAVGDAQRLRVVNDFGNVYARTGDRQVEISTVAQRQDGDPYRLLLATRKEGEVLVIEVKARLEEGKTDDGGALAGHRRRLDITLFQPPGLPLQVEAEDSIETKKLRCDVDLLARKGHIVVDNFGHVKAVAFDKEIRGVLRDTRWTTPGEISTRSGDIQLYFLDDADLAIEATSMGALTTDYSVEIERQPGHRRKTARAKLGQGRSKLLLRSEIGQIQILLNV